MRLEAFALLVPEYDEGLRVLRDRPRVPPPVRRGSEGAKRWVVVAPLDGGTPLLLARAVGPEQEAAIGRQAGGRVGFFLRCNDIEAARAQLLAAGASFEEEPRREPYGTVAVWRDPWNNRWDLLGPP